MLGRKHNTEMTVELTLLAAQLCGVHSLAQHLDSHSTRLLQIAVLLVILLEETLRTCVVCANARRFPASVISTGVTLVQLELTEMVIPSVDEGDTKRTETSVLGISLLQITQSTDKLFAWNVFVVREEVALGVLASIVDQNVGIGVHTRNSADHVTGNHQLLISILNTANLAILFETKVVLAYSLIV